MPMRFVLVLCVPLSAGCDALRGEAPGLFTVAPQASAAERSTSKSASDLSRLARNLENKFKPPALPELTPEHDCSRASVEETDADAKRLVLAYVDARTLTKNLIPRRISERLESGESALLEASFDFHPNTDGAALRHDVPHAAVSLTAEDLERIRRQRFLGVFYVTHFQGPALILRVGKIRREWYPGQLGGKFVLFDTEKQRMVCGASLHVVNDVKAAPIRSRLQSETRGRLERALGDALRAAAERSLTAPSLRLEWPESALTQGSTGLGS